MTAVDRTPKPCLHPRANHQHGTYLAYDKDHCRCWPCVGAAGVRGRLERRQTATGTSSYVPAGRAREHVRQLLEVLSVGQVEQRSGVHRTAIRILVGDWPSRPMSKRITRRTEAALLAVKAEHLGPERHGLVDGTGTRRRFRALVALGWTQKYLGDRHGWSSRTRWYLTDERFPDSAPVMVSTRDAVRRLYDELSLATPPASRAATRARKLAAARRWAPPLAWDDESIDDPQARPTRGWQLDAVIDEVAIERAMAGDEVHLRPVERAEAVHRLTAKGLSAAEIAERLRVDKKSVQRIRGQRRAEEAA